jgi:hypothetical protein
VQSEILAKNPSADLKVYVVWLPMLATDARALWDPTIISSAQAKHYWDKDKAISAWFSKLPGDYEGVDWDVYYLFGPEARWEDKPTPIRSVGATILYEQDKLLKSIEPLLQK